MHLCNVLEIKQNPSQLVLLLLCCYTQNISYHNRVSNFGFVALQNAKCNVNPGLSHFEQCALACVRLLANIHLHFAFRQSKASKATLSQKKFLKHFIGTKHKPLMFFTFSFFFFQLLNTMQRYIPRCTIYILCVPILKTCTSQYVLSRYISITYVLQFCINTTVPTTKLHNIIEHF